MALFAGFVSIASVSAEPDLPGWLAEDIGEQAERLADVHELPRLPFFELHYRPDAAPPGVRIIEAEAQRETVVAAYRGDWSSPSPQARLDMVRNLAHELAHVRQRLAGLPTEDRLLHEGFAEAMAIDALRRCGAACNGQPEVLLTRRERQCGEALRLGPLRQREDEPAVYGCGAVLIDAVAQASGRSPAMLYTQFAASSRDRDAFFAVLRRGAGKRFTLSARSFLRDDYRLANPRQTLTDLRAGRL